MLLLIEYMFTINRIDDANNRILNNVTINSITY